MTMQHWLPQTQPWLLAQERDRAQQAIEQYGEYTIWYLLWNINDHEDGLVDYCPTCMANDPISLDTFKQPSDQNCPDCLGTAFEGGYRARIVRPTLWRDDDETQKAHTARGELNVDRHTVQTVGGFTAFNGDILIRYDNSRWQINVPQSSQVRTGFGAFDKTKGYMGYNVAPATLEQKGSVSYTFDPVDSDDVLTLLTVPSYPRGPVDFTAFEQIRAPLLRP